MSEMVRVGLDFAEGCIDVHIDDIPRAPGCTETVIGDNGELVTDSAQDPLILTDETARERQTSVRRLRQGREESRAAALKAMALYDF